MTKQEFIFSNKISHRITRHLAFWLVFGLIFAIQSFGDPLGGFISETAVSRALKLTLVNLPFCIISVYFFSNFLFPLFLKKRKYASFIAGFITMILMGFWINYFASAWFFKIISVNNITLPQRILISLTWVWSGVAAGGFVLGFKLAKHWYRQKNENHLLAKQKVNKELRLLKARIHPDFLFKTLDDIYKKINSGSDKSPVMILKLSEMLSYLLYESDQEYVSLEKELAAVTDFISISELTEPSRKVSLKITGIRNHKFIPSLVLLTLVQNCFSEIFTHEKNRINTTIIISVEDNLLTFTLSFQHQKKEDSCLENLNAFVQSEQRRINLLSPENDYIPALSFGENKAELILIILLNNKDQIAKLNSSKKEMYETA